MSSLDFRNRLGLVVLPALSPVAMRLEKVQKSEERKPFDTSYKLKTRKFPYSCTDEEGLILYHIINENKLCSGYEIATAFGYSSLYLGLALRNHGGSLASLDCYIEEGKESFHYTEAEIRNHVVLLKEKIGQGHIPEGLAFARQSAHDLGLDGTIQFNVGVSPDDVTDVIKKKPVDLAFIDGGHFGEQPTIDFESVRPFLAEKCAVFFHDNNGNPAVERAIKSAEGALKSPARNLNTYYGLTLVGRGLEPISLSEISSLPKRKAHITPKILDLPKRIVRKIKSLVAPRAS